jgi:hypothetical protein
MMFALIGTTGDRDGSAVVGDIVSLGIVGRMVGVVTGALDIVGSTVGILTGFAVGEPVGFCVTGELVGSGIVGD